MDTTSIGGIPKVVKEWDGHYARSRLDILPDFGSEIEDENGEIVKKWGKDE